MKKLLALILSLLMPAALFACKKEEEPPALTDQNGEAISPFSDTNTDPDRYYMSRGGLIKGFVYGDDYYYFSNSCTIAAVPLTEVVKHNVVEEGKATYVNAVTPLCFDPMCQHNRVSCPAMMRDPNAQFLIEATESNGGLPVIYYFRSTGETLEEDGTLTSFGCEIIRFDVAEGTAERVVFTEKPIKQLMAYGDSLYYITQESDESYAFNAVKKSGEGLNSTPLDVGPLKLIGAGRQGAYFNDGDGNVYATDLGGDNFKLIYTVSEVYVMGPPGTGAAELNMFVNGDHLYFYADHEAHAFVKGSGLAEYDVNYIEHSIRRVRLDAPNGEGELVVEGVFETEVYGVYNGVLYYGPFDVATQLKGNDCDTYYHSKGTINGVNLETRETFTVMSDCGFNFRSAPYYVNDRCIIGTMYPYREMDCYTSNGLWTTMLLDFETGALYSLQIHPQLLQPQN